ncbi:GNAT family N-acetyltransferase [Pseudomonas gingeri]|uniref:GNAT family N-acetyltransferase n=1 Tax=Pseudomonas gingeri TaxID=117681 RepID=UPI0015A3E55F|nr:GNAT family N-acetyltransferase [Pseudomonas gingeri]NVZ99025.1 GNAT family N-acetyltransferase [Pseudomonas gingeri]NWA13070.1 GNAT family N-acetyltransferase [Pseudomonas gingeri]NWA55331.1 GNAT family N-acetyltransferase [Pseudomonas gingeri]NWA95815.1 GNAT family N-acetyltransferase [Pseudomonas gingeri]NWB00903.1 GNAT family N-acetyltransferase [Pseudomonas gingeri]
MPAETPSVVIERFREAHVEGITALYNEPAVCRQVLQMPFQSAEAWRQRLIQRQDNERLLSLVALHEGGVIGSCSLEQYSRVRRSHAGTIGMGVATAWQGKGVGSQLLAAVLEVADNWMNLQRVELCVYADNAAAQGLYRKFGFEEEGVMRDYAIRDGRLVDTLNMARLRRSLA